jgi:hypothetical protein
VWQRYWDGRERDFTMLAVAQDVRGEDTVRPIVEERGVTFPVLLDRASALAAGLGFQIVPSGVFVDADGAVAYRHADDFHIGDPRVRRNLDAFLAGDELEPPGPARPTEPEALERFADGVRAYAAGDRSEALALWRTALAHDPDNFLIRSQIWAVEHPQHFYPVVDRDWQERKLLEEGYDKPLP